MKNFAIATDSASCLKYFSEAGSDIEVLPLYLVINGEHKLDDVDIDNETFIKWMQAHPNEAPYSRPPTESDIDNMIQRWLDLGYERALFVSLSSALSQTYRLFKNAAKKYQDRIDIAVFDSKSQSFMQVMLLLEGKRLLEKGFGFSTIVTRLDVLRHSGALFFTLSSLEYLIRNGQVPKSYAMISKMLNTYPILAFNSAGQIRKIAEKRGLESTLEDCLTRCDRFIDGREVDIFITHPKDSSGHHFEQNIRQHFAGMNITSFPTSPVIACHTGPGLYGIGAFIKT